MQQQPPQMIPGMQSFAPANISTEQIQKCLDENNKLILAILDYQNLGKLAECAQYQALLQKNLMNLAAIADAQPPQPAMPPQMAQHPAAMQSRQGAGYFMQHPQAQAHAQAQQQAGLFPPKMPLQYGSSPHQLQHLQETVPPAGVVGPNANGNAETQQWNASSSNAASTP